METYLKNLSALLSKDGVGPDNIELVLSWAKEYQPLHLTGQLSRNAFDAIMKKTPKRLISFISMGRKFKGSSFNTSTRDLIALLKSDVNSCVSYGIYYVS